MLKKIMNTILYITSILAYTAFLTMIIWYAGTVEKRICRVEGILVEAGLWPAGEKPSKGAIEYVEDLLGHSESTGE